MEDCMRINIELKTILRTMENTNDNYTKFSLQVVAMVHMKDKKRASYIDRNLHINPNLNNSYHVPQKNEKVIMLILTGILLDFGETNFKNKQKMFPITTNTTQKLTRTNNNLYLCTSKSKFIYRN